MSGKLIYADVIKAKLNNSMKNNATMWNDAYNEGLYQAEKIIDFAPAVDAVEVVRCKECKYWGSPTENQEAICRHWSSYYGSIRTMDYQYCSCGERR